MSRCRRRRRSSRLHWPRLLRRRASGRLTPMLKLVSAFRRLLTGAARPCPTRPPPSTAGPSPGRRARWRSTGGQASAAAARKEQSRCSSRRARCRPATAPCPTAPRIGSRCTIRWRAASPSPCVPTPATPSPPAMTWCCRCFRRSPSCSRRAAGGKLTPMPRPATVFRPLKTGRAQPGPTRTTAPYMEDPSSARRAASRCTGGQALAAPARAEPSPCNWRRAKCRRAMRRKPMGPRSGARSATR